MRMDTVSVSWIYLICISIFTKKDKETEKYTFADIIFDLEQQKKKPCFVDDKGNVYYQVIESGRKFFVR